MQNDNLTQLQKIAALKNFPKDAYICCEGQPGDEMYIILKGEVGVYLTSAIGSLYEISRIKQGNFFGEMSLFDDLPRSATCIAMEDTLCAAINRSSIHQFLVNCPGMAEKMLENMSLRVRELDKELYKIVYSAQKRRVENFAIPGEYVPGKKLPEPEGNSNCFETYRQSCPICKKEITLVQIPRHMLSVQKMEPDGRLRYDGCDPLWHEVLTCHYCHYSNHHLSFFKVNSANYEHILNLLREQHAPVISTAAHWTVFDRVVLKYLQAIHINEVVDSGNDALIGILWLYLHWLAKDAEDTAFAVYCAQNAADKLSSALGKGQVQDVTNRCTISLALSNLFILLNMPEMASEYCNKALVCPDKRVARCAFKLKEKLLL